MSVDGLQPKLKLLFTKGRKLDMYPNTNPRLAITPLTCWMIETDILLISVVQGERFKELVYVMSPRATVIKCIEYHWGGMSLMST